MKINHSTTPFKTGGSIAVRIPKKFNLKLEDEIDISSPQEGVIVIRVNDKLWEEQLTDAVQKSVESKLWENIEEPSDPAPEEVEVW